ncbi:MAG: EAL domain-containing protein [Acidimicrobiales bacterium]
MPPQPQILFTDEPADAQRSLEVDALPGYFTLHFQPELDLESRAVVACEALLRWVHPEYGVLRPGAALEQSGWSDALVEAEDWATTAVAEELAGWQAAGLDLQVALNVSARQLENAELATTIGRALERSGARPEQLRVDIPIGAFTTQRLVVVDTVRRLADLGVAVVADGVTGDPRSPLAGLPVSVLKINIHVGGRLDLTRLHPAVAGSLRLAKELGATSVAKAVRRPTTWACCARSGSTAPSATS